MISASAKRRKKNNLPAGIRSRLTHYTLATGAMLAGGSAARANVVEWDPTNDAAFLPVSNTSALPVIFFDLRSGKTSTGTSNAAAPASAQFKLQLSVSPPCTSSQLAKAVNIASNGVMVSNNYAARLGGGATVGPGGQFNSNAQLGHFSIFPIPSPHSSGNWRSGDSGFLGLRFTTDSGATFNYGWAEVQINANAYDATLEKFAYETDADTAILTPAPVPEPSELVLFALGSGGLAIVRARRKSKRRA
jgi:hypothetical protein